MNIAAYESAPFAGHTYSQAEDKLMDDIIMFMWADHAVWEIACAVQDRLGRRITARQVWGAWHRLKRSYP
jgi:hypothetical protein